MWGVLLFLSLSHPPPEFFPFSPPPTTPHPARTAHPAHTTRLARSHEPTNPEARKHTHTQTSRLYKPCTNHVQYSNKTKDGGENKRGDTLCNEGITPRPMPRPEARKARHDESRRPHHATQQRQPSPMLTPSTQTRHDPPPPPACAATAHRENQTAGSTQETGNGSGNQTSPAGPGAGYPDQLPGSDSQPRCPKPRQDHAPRTDHQRPGDPEPLPLPYTNS